MPIIRKAALIYIKDRKALMVRSQKNKYIFYNLGGKYEGSETDLECLTREVKEEVGVQFDSQTVQFLKEFRNIAHGKDGESLIMRVYIGKLLSDPVPSSEIVEIHYFDSSADSDTVTPMGKEILLYLKEQNYID